MFSRKGAEQIKKNVLSLIQYLVFMCKMMFKQHSKDFHTNTQSSQIMHSEVNAISASPFEIIFISIQQPGCWFLAAIGRARYQKDCHAFRMHSFRRGIYKLSYFIFPDEIQEAGAVNFMSSVVFIERLFCLQSYQRSMNMKMPPENEVKAFRYLT